MTNRQRVGFFTPWDTVTGTGTLVLLIILALPFFALASAVRRIRGMMSDG